MKYSMYSCKFIQLKTILKSINEKQLEIVCMTFDSTVGQYVIVVVDKSIDHEILEAEQEFKNHLKRLSTQKNEFIEYFTKKAKRFDRHNIGQSLNVEEDLNSSYEDMAKSLD